MGISLMKAAVFDRYGEPEVLHCSDVPVPELARGEALVKVRSVALNGYDLMVRSGRYRPNQGKFPHILGGDFSGELVALDDHAKTTVAIGTRVTGWCLLPCGYCEQCVSGFPNRCAREYRYLGAHEKGAYAQYVKLPAHHLIPLPDAVGFDDAAAFPVAFGTAWRMIKRANVRPGERVLINAASSGVSLAAIQICKLLGAHVYASSSSDLKLEKARTVGADEGINHTVCDFTDEIMKRTGKRGVDVVIEHVGGDFLDKSIRCLTRGGRLVTTGGTKSYECTILVNYIFHKELQIIGSNSFTQLDLETMLPMLANGRLKATIEKIFPLDQAAEAHRYLESGKPIGKVLLRVEP